jgi:two-component system, NtrC family, nitrogen regulation sensor histidine kinase NtrY
VIANVATGVVSLDEEGRVETFNERAAEILGMSAAGVQGRPLAEVLTGDAGRIADLVAEARRGDAPRQEGQLVLKLPQGRRTLAVVATAFHGEGRSLGTVVVCEDLTQVLASQRLEAWKEAVERVIHEIKNPLTPVGLAAETLKTAHERDREKFDALFPSAIEMILSSVRSLKELISEFGRFSRLPRLRLSRVSPNDLVRSALGPYAQGGLSGVAVRVDLAPGLPEVEADPEQLNRVLLNVANNALEALEGRSGELRVATSRAEGGVLITLADDGPGVEDVERIFEPHYTTKVKGTGLGLAIARQIVEEHRGRITVESTVGRGTTVRIHLPAAPVAGGP